MSSVCTSICERWSSRSFGSAHPVPMNILSPGLIRESAAVGVDNRNSPESIGWYSQNHLKLDVVTLGRLIISNLELVRYIEKVMVR